MRCRLLCLHQLGIGPTLPEASHQDFFYLALIPPQDRSQSIRKDPFEVFRALLLCDGGLEAGSFPGRCTGHRSTCVAEWWRTLSPSLFCSFVLLPGKELMIQTMALPWHHQGTAGVSNPCSSSRTSKAWWGEGQVCFLLLASSRHWLASACVH